MPTARKNFNFLKKNISNHSKPLLTRTAHIRIHVSNLDKTRKPRFTMSNATNALRKYKNEGQWFSKT